MKKKMLMEKSLEGMMMEEEEEDELIVCKMIERAFLGVGVRAVV